MWRYLVIPTAILLGCNLADDDSITPYRFMTSERHPTRLDQAAVEGAINAVKQPGDTISSVSVFAAEGIGQSVVQIVTKTDENARAYVVDEDGKIYSTQQFWALEKRAKMLRYGRLSPDLYDTQSNLNAADTVEVDIFVAADVS